MKPLFFTLSLITVLLTACSADSLVGPANGDRALEPAESCSINAKLC